MDNLRNKLPVILEGSGAAVAILFAVVAALSYGDPLTAVLLTAAGIAMGGVVAGFGALLRTAMEATSRVRQIQGDVRALGNASIKLLREAREQGDT